LPSRFEQDRGPRTFAYGRVDAVDGWELIAGAELEEEG